MDPHEQARLGRHAPGLDWLFLALGAALIVATMAFGPIAVPYLLGMVVGAVAILAAHSWFSWKDDPERIPPANTSPAKDNP